MSKGWVQSDTNLRKQTGGSVGDISALEHPHDGHIAIITIIVIITIKIIIVISVKLVV